MGLPFQAFYNFPNTIGKRHHPVPHSFDLRYNPKKEWGNIVAERGCFEFPPESRRRALPSYQHLFLMGEGNTKPAFTAFDKQHLVFWAYYVDSPAEGSSLHRCKITYFLEDDTMMIYEPWVKNSQLWQGTIVKRHRFPKPSPVRDQYYLAEDLNIGMDLHVYGRIYHIVECDGFTRDFLTKIGVKVGPAEEMPQDCYSTLRLAMERSEPKKPLDRGHDDKGQFYRYNGRVLRFYGVWNDTASLYGDKRYFVLHYFLEDDTIELIEQYPNNCGRMPCNFFLRRSRVPKTLEPLAMVGHSQTRNILNAFGGGVGSKQKLRLMIDPHQVGDKPQDCWTDRDLYVGAEIDIYGRRVFLYDCDEQTRTYYKTKYGIDNCPINVREPCKTTPPWVIPPNSLKIGGDLDTLGCIKSITPKPPPLKNKAQYLQFDRNGAESFQLRFFAKLDKVDDPVDRNRTFIISYFLADDTIQIFEPARDNSGFRGGVFLNRQKIKKGDEFDPLTGQPYYWDLSDFYVGAVVTLFERTFKISDADEYCYSYLENYPQFFPKSNIKVIMEKIKPQLAGRKEAVKKMFEEKDSQCTNKVHPEDFRSILRLLMPGLDSITDHEVMTVMRFYGDRKDPNMSLEQLATLARSLLQKSSYMVQERTLLPLMDKDKDHTGLLTPREIYFTLRACHLPLEPELLKNIITRMPTSENRYISYKDLVHALAWEDKVGTVHHPEPVRYDYRLISEEVPGITGVRYKEFLHAAGVLSAQPTSTSPQPEQAQEVAPTI